MGCRGQVRVCLLGRGRRWPIARADLCSSDTALRPRYRFHDPDRCGRKCFSRCPSRGEDQRRGLADPSCRLCRGLCSLHGRCRLGCFHVRIQHGCRDLEAPEKSACGSPSRTQRRTAAPRDTVRRERIDRHDRSGTPFARNHGPAALSRLGAKRLPCR